MSESTNGHVKIDLSKHGIKELRRKMHAVCDPRQFCQTNVQQLAKPMAVVIHTPIGPEKHRVIGIVTCRNCEGSLAIDTRTIDGCDLPVIITRRALVNQNLVWANLIRANKVEMTAT